MEVQERRATRHWLFMRWSRYLQSRESRWKQFRLAVRRSVAVWLQGCAKLGKACMTDIVNGLAVKFEKADGLVVASPVYYASANATLIACLDRLFYSSHFDKTMKVGASVVCARRGGCSATFDELNKYFTISRMPVASSQYWNSVHGRTPGEAEGDGEGRQTMRTLARNMAFLMKSIALGKEQFGLPEKEERISTNFMSTIDTSCVKNDILCKLS